MHACTFSGNIRARASVNAFTISRNVHECAYVIIRARASVNILACTSVCLFVHVRASVRIRAHDPTGIRDRGGCYVCLYVVIQNTK